MTVLLLFCTCAYLRSTPFSSLVAEGAWGGLPFKFARVGERASPLVGVACAVMGVYVLFR